MATLNQADGYPASGFGVGFQGVLRVGDEGTRLVKQLLNRMQLVIYGREACIARLVSKFVDPTALKGDMVIYLGHHLLELARVYPVGAHGRFLPPHVFVACYYVRYTTGRDGVQERV